MSLLISDASLDARRSAVRGPLRPLAASLAADLEPLLQRDIFFPAEKAVLSREGGRCSRDGTLLEFDPFQPHEHRCPRCGERYEGELHYRFWIYWYQLWLAERAVHAAALSTLGVDARFGALAEAILDGYAGRYSAYPNVDNVLGPTRLFFSTYLESIWLLQICVAASLIRRANGSLAGRVADRIVEPSRQIIAEYNEGASNRQVWNAVALLAAARLLDDSESVDTSVNAHGGIVSHMANGLLPDGTWYEGENYHLFAHRGLWYGVTMAEGAGLDLPRDLAARFHRGFLTPFMSALPDFTLPSRRDSQYAISLRQWRIAEHCELGFARTGDTVLGGALARLYHDDVPRRETGRRTSSADVERNMPPSALDRSDLGWRALLCARESLPALEPIVPQSCLLDSQGLGVFRRDDGRAYVALDYGHSGGGHGHPDRLNLLLMAGETRWLDDYGTGSYVDESLHWYRSTLAHNAPLIDGTSQRPVDGRLIAYDERGAAGWISSTVDDLALESSVTRTVVTMPEYVIDELTWTASNPVTIDLPLHADIALEACAGVSDAAVAPLEGGQGTEDGFRFAHDSSVQRAPAGSTVRGGTSAGRDRLMLWSRSSRDAEWWRAAAPGPPGTGDRSFRVIRAAGAEGTLQTLMAWSDAVVDVALGPTIQVTLGDGTRHEHSRTDAGWHVELFAGTARSSIDLGGIRPRAEPRPVASNVTGDRAPIALPPRGAATSIALSETSYRRSEQTWSAAGSPSAEVSLAWRDASLHVEVRVAVSDLTFAAAESRNRYDNEHPDINGDSIQLYVRTDTGRSGWMLVPELASSSVRARALEGWTDPATLSASWRRAGEGYLVVADIADVVPRAIDVIVNERPAGRERRRGQLVLSGGAGDFVYLRGDRHDVMHLVPLRLPDV